MKTTLTKLTVALLILCPRLIAAEEEPRVPGPMPPVSRCQSLCNLAIGLGLADVWSASQFLQFDIYGMRRMANNQRYSLNAAALAVPNSKDAAVGLFANAIYSHSMHGYYKHQARHADINLLLMGVGLTSLGVYFHDRDNFIAGSSSNDFVDYTPQVLFAFAPRSFALAFRIVI